MNKKEIKHMFKKSSDELAMYFHFKKRGYIKQNKKGKGSYKRKAKHPKKED